MFIQYAFTKDLFYIRQWTPQCKIKYDFYPQKACRITGRLDIYTSLPTLVTDCREVRNHA